jgi:hypothetical protein
MLPHVPRKTFVFHIKKNGQIENTIVRGDDIRDRKITEVIRKGRATCSFDSRNLIAHQEFESVEDAEKYIEQFEYLRDNNLLKPAWGENSG